MKLLLLVVGFLYCLVDFRPAHSVPISEKVLLVSDIHFKPTEGYSLAELRRTPVNDWIAKIFNEENPVTPLFDSDCNYRLLVSAMENMKRLVPNPKMIIVCGDLLWHRKPFETDTAFLDSTLKFIALEFHNFFPLSPVLPCLGNNDADTDNALQTRSFLNRYAKSFLQYTGAVNRDSFTLHQGCYAYNIPQTNIRLISLNSSLISSKGDQALEVVQAPQMYNWFNHQLAQRNPLEKIWLLFHIPPGNDVCLGRAGSSDYHSTWSNWGNRFLSLITRNKKAITFCLAGHTHRDDFRILEIGGKPAALIKIIPAVCTYYCNNPSFSVADFDPSDGVVYRITTHYMAINDRLALKPPKDWSGEFSLTSEAATGINASFVEYLIDNPSWRNEYNCRLGSYTKLNCGRCALSDYLNNYFGTLKIEVPPAK